MRIGKISKIEGCMLLLTGLFLCGVLGLYVADRTNPSPGETVIETELQPAPELLEVDDSPVNINTATAEELDVLPGIGEALAARIVAYRETNGPFASVEEIMEVSGIGEAKYGELLGLISVE